MSETIRTLIALDADSDRDDAAQRPEMIEQIV